MQSSKALPFTGREVKRSGWIDCPRYRRQLLVSLYTLGFELKYVFYKALDFLMELVLA